GLQRSDADRVRPQWRGEVRIELYGHDLGQVAQRWLPECVHQRRVDVAVLQSDPCLVQRPGAVHLDVRLADRRPGADRVESFDESERHTGQVIAASGNGEPDVLLADARALDGVV